MHVLPQLNAALAGRYVIEREIGQGGMATVFLAHDAKHDRSVALKVLNPELGALLGKERFLGEIRITAKLQHPNLLPLFDSGEASGQLFYVMPFVDGESLRDRLRREKQLPIDDAIRIASAVGTALEYAHRHGVVHRDLKPENILIQDGHSLVADFGIALALSAAGGARITQTGLSLGTPQYMSPEQATGDRIIDSRTDIYSLGALLYEMLTGDPPHTGSTAQAIIAKVVTEKPRPMRVTRESVPRHVEAAVACALAKLPADRFASALDFVNALHETLPAAVPSGYIERGSTASDLPLVAAQRRRRSLGIVPWVLAVAAAIVAMALWLRPKEAPRVSRFQLAVSQAARFRMSEGVSIALSPDGRRLVYEGGPEGGGQLFARGLDDLEPKPIRGTERATSPVFSPDGRSLIFLADGRLKRVDLDGGPAVTVSDSGGQATWGDGGIFFTRTPALYGVSPSGGPIRRVAGVGALRGATRLTWPWALPGGQAALVTIRGKSASITSAHLGVVRFADGQVTDLEVVGVNPKYLPTGHVIFGRAEGVVYGMAFDVKRLRLSGPAVPLIEDVVVKGGGATEVVVARDGTMAYRSGTSARTLVLVDRRGVAAPLLDEPRDYTFPAVSPDGRRIAVTIGATTNLSDTWIFDTQSGALTRLTRGGGERPAWTPDGKTVLTMRQDSVNSIVAQPWDGSGAPAGYAVAELGILEISLPRLQSGFLAARVGAGGPRDIWTAPVDSPRALRPFVATEADEFAPTVSPDGKWLAYLSNESGRYEVYVRALDGSGGRVQISTNGAIEPLWSPTGRELFYRADQKIIAARITWQGGTAHVEREALFDDIYPSNASAHVTYSVMPDGNRFVFVQSTGSGPATIVVLNWFEEVRRRMAAAGR